MVILYPSLHEASAARLERIVRMVAIREDIMIYRTIKALSKGLRQLHEDEYVVILNASCMDEFKDILSMRELLRDIKSILILPDNSQETVAKGHLLRPRFISDSQSNFHDVAAVLSRMLDNLNAGKGIITDPETERPLRRRRNPGTATYGSYHHTQ